MLLNLLKTMQSRAGKIFLEYNVKQYDVVIGIAASGTTPYVIGALEKCRGNIIYQQEVLLVTRMHPVSNAADFPY